MNPLQAAIMAAQAEAGPLEIALRDNGGASSRMVAQQARTVRFRARMRGARWSR